MESEEWFYGKWRMIYLWLMVLSMESEELDFSINLDQMTLASVLSMCVLLL
jgi:hypothetical protein